MADLSNSTFVSRRLDEQYDFDPKEHVFGAMPPILSSHYRMMFQFFQTRARALTRITQGWPREDDENVIRMVDHQASYWGLTPRQFGFVDPPKLVEGEAMASNTGTLFAAIGAPSVN